MIWPSSASGDLEPLERPGRRALEVDPGDIEPAAVARALELLLAGQPVGRAAQVGADRLERVDDVLAVVLGRADDPEAPLGLESVADVLGIDIATAGRS